MVGYGRRLFDGDRHDPVLTSAPRPDYLAYLPPGWFPSLWWGDDTQPGTGEADVVLHLGAGNAAAVGCAAVEIWKLLVDEKLPLRVVGSFDGFARPDGRGWLEFHDGVSNLPAEDREVAVTATDDPPWMSGGTYMTFLRVEVDLTAWRRLTRDGQELAVGRNKLSGVRLLGVDRDETGRARPVTASSSGSAAQDRLDWIDPPQVSDELLEMSHIHRVNQHRSTPSAPGGWRMFRQGYDYLERLGPDGPVLGLNFVSFQTDLAVIQHVMHLAGWLGDVNFGGRPGDPALRRPTTLSAGGLYALPPVGRAYPGEILFAKS